MKRLELSIFRRLALSIIGIILIPIIVLIINEVTSRSNLELEEKRQESMRNLNFIYTKLVESYSSLEAIQLILKGDTEFLDFITNPSGHTPLEYVSFERKELKNYQKILLTSKEIKNFKIYVNNENMFNMYPFIYNRLPKDKNLDNQAKLLIRGGTPYLYYFKEIYFYPKKVYLEMEVDLSKIFKENIMNYYLVDKDKILNIDNIEDFSFDHILKKVIFKENQKINSVKDKDALYIFQTLPFTDVKLLHVIKQNSIIDIKYLGYLVFLAFFVLIVIYFTSFIISKKIFRQLNLIFDAVNEIKKGRLDINFTETFDHKEFGELANQLKSMAKNLDALILENIENQDLIYDFQMKALQSQINSHFLQNSLEGIKMMAYINRDYEVSTSLLYLGKILRYGMDWKNPIVTVKDEIEYIEQYISLFSIRTENSIEFRTFIDENLMKKKLPKMIFQPLIENSIIHGIIPKDVKGLIQFRAYTKDNKCIFEILDNGKGIENYKNNSENDRIGLNNVQKRLQLFFDKRTTFDIFSISNKFTKIKITIEECDEFEKNISS